MHKLTLIPTVVERPTRRPTLRGRTAPRLLWAAPAPARIVASSLAAALLSFSLTWMFVML